MIPVVITASPAALRYRLAARGREEAAAVAARLRRATEKHIDDPSIITIDNSGALEHAGWRFIYLLRRAAAGLAQI